MIIKYEINVIKSIAIKLYEFRKKICFSEIRILSFFVDTIIIVYTIVIIKFRFLLKDIFVKNVFINIIFDLFIFRQLVFLTFNIILICFNKRSPLKFIIVKSKRIFVIIIIFNVCFLLTRLTLLKRFVYVFVNIL